jgi:hypothetical protein
MPTIIRGLDGSQPLLAAGISGGMGQHERGKWREPSDAAVRGLAGSTRQGTGWRRSLNPAGAPSDAGGTAPVLTGNDTRQYVADLCVAHAPRPAGREHSERRYGDGARCSMAGRVGPRATTSCEPRQARKGAAAAVTSCAVVWLARFRHPFVQLKPPTRLPMKRSVASGTLSAIRLTDPALP